jgi:hypothetical protein
VFIEGAKSEYDVMNDFLEFDVAIWVTRTREDREIINHVLRKYLPTEMADYYASRHRWTLSQIEILFEKLTSGRRSKAKTRAIKLPESNRRETKRAQTWKIAHSNYTNSSITGVTTVIFLHSGQQG